MYVLDSAHVKFDVCVENELLHFYSTANTNRSIVTDSELNMNLIPILGSTQVQFNILTGLKVRCFSFV